MRDERWQRTPSSGAGRAQCVGVGQGWMELLGSEAGAGSVTENVIVLAEGATWRGATGSFLEEGAAGAVGVGPRGSAMKPTYNR
jgi:hypothetical protein